MRSGIWNCCFSIFKEIFDMYEVYWYNKNIEIIRDFDYNEIFKSMKYFFFCLLRDMKKMEVYNNENFL